MRLSHPGITVADSFPEYTHTIATMMNTAPIDKVRALMAKAESTTYPAEADAFMAKAQALIDQYAIDDARLRGVDPSLVGHETVPFVGSYTRERSMIWAAVAQANRCQVLTLSSYGSSKVTELTIIGRPDDRELVKIVASSLEVQALRRLGQLELDSWESPVVQRRSFLRGFSGEVARRLAETQRKQHAYGKTAAALELAADAVGRYVESNFDVSSRRTQARHDGRAYSRGRRAGASADVGAGRIGGDHRALGR